MIFALIFGVGVFAAEHHREDWSSYYYIGVGLAILAAVVLIGYLVAVLCCKAREPDECKTPLMNPVPMSRTSTMKQITL